MNLYRFVHNTPLIFVDFYGLKTIAEACPNIVAYFDTAIQSGIDCEQSLANTLNSLKGNIIIMQNYYDILVQQNAQNANTSILFLLFGNVATVGGTISVVALEAAVSQKVTGVETIVHMRAPNGRFIKVPAATKNILQTAAKVNIVATTVSWAVSVGLNALSVYATAGLTGQTLATLDEFKALYNTIKQSQTNVVAHTEGMISVYDSLSIVNIEDINMTTCDCKKLLKAYKMLYDSVVDGFKSIVEANDGVIDLSSQAVKVLNETLIR